MYYFIPAGLLTSFVAYYKGFAVAVFVGIMLFAAPVFVYSSARWVDLLYQGFANRQGHYRKRSAPIPTGRGGSSYPSSDSW